MLAPPVIMRFLRYVLVGLSTNAIGYILYLIVTTFGPGPKTTMSLLYLVGATIGYFGNRKWVFRHSGSIWRSSTGYFIFHAGGYLINLGLLYVFVDRLGYPHQLIQAVAIVIVACYLFLAFNTIVFKDAQKDSRLSG